MTHVNASVTSRRADGAVQRGGSRAEQNTHSANVIRFPSASILAAPIAPLESLNPFQARVDVARLLFWLGYFLLWCIALCLIGGAIAKLLLF